MKWRPLILGTLVVAGTPFVPAIPSDMELVYSYQTTPEAIASETARINALLDISATSSEKYQKPPLPPHFKDADKNGVISVSVFRGRDGEFVYEQIDDKRYDDMRGKTEEGKGASANPKKQELISVFDATAAEAAVARDTFVNITGSGAGGTSVTYSHTTSGSDRYLLVYVGDQQGDTVTGCTYNSVSMTQLAKETRSPNEGSLQIYAYGIANPTSGANNVSCSRSGTVGQLFVSSISYTGVTQTTSPVDATATSNGAGVAGTSLTTSITTVADNTAVSGYAIMDNGSVAAGTNETSLNSNSSGFIMWESSTFPKTPAGATSYTVTGFAGSARGQIVISLAPSGVATFNPYQMFPF